MRRLRKQARALRRQRKRLQRAVTVASLVLIRKRSPEPRNSEVALRLNGAQVTRGGEQASA